MTEELPLSVNLRLGWSNADTGPEGTRLYADEQEARWAKPQARVAETLLRESGGAVEGSRWTLTERRADITPRRFVLRRDVDHTGVSGAGQIAEGVQFSDGRVALRWVGSPSASTGVWDSIDHVLAVHGHNGATVVVWLDEPAVRVGTGGGET